MLRAEILGEALRALELCRHPVRTEDEDTPRSQGIAKPFHQRLFRADHDEPDTVGAAEIRHRRMVAGIEGNEFGMRRNPGIAGRRP